MTHSQSWTIVHSPMVPYLSRCLTNQCTKHFKGKKKMRTKKGRRGQRKAMDNANEDKEMRTKEREPRKGRPEKASCD